MSRDNRHTSMLGTLNLGGAPSQTEVASTWPTWVGFCRRIANGDQLTIPELNVFRLAYERLVKLGVRFDRDVVAHLRHRSYLAPAQRVPVSEAFDLPPSVVPQG
jgi:hypothetical protein